MRPVPLIDISGSTRVFYSRYGIQITDRWFATAEHRYRLADLADIKITRERVNPVTVGALLGSALTFLVGLAITARTGSANLLAATTMASGALLTVGCVSALVRPRHHVILATVRGIQVTLFATRDRSVQSQIGRALDRANRSSLAASSRIPDQRPAAADG